MSLQGSEMITIVYVSRPRPELSPFDILGILESARRNNRMHGVTGVLFASARTFLQVIEGPEEQVRATFARISADSRHDQVTVLARAPIARRRFQRWYMRSLAAAEATALIGSRDDLLILSEWHIWELIDDICGTVSCRWIGEQPS